MNDFGSRLHKAQVLEASEHLEASVGVEPLTGQPVVLFRVQNQPGPPKGPLIESLWPLVAGGQEGVGLG